MSRSRAGMLRGVRRGRGGGGKRQWCGRQRSARWRGIQSRRCRRHRSRWGHRAECSGGRHCHFGCESCLWCSSTCMWWWRQYAMHGDWLMHGAGRGACACWGWSLHGSCRRRCCRCIHFTGTLAEARRQARRAGHIHCIPLTIRMLNHLIRQRRRESRGSSCRSRTTCCFRCRMCIDGSGCCGWSLPLG